MSNDVALQEAFDYTKLESDVAVFLQSKAERIQNAVGKAYTEIGRELAEAQERLASHNKYEGVFETWYSSMGFKMQTVYNLINRYKYVLQNLEDMPQIEDLPLSLSYEVSKPSAPKELQQAVLSGDIMTHKEYKEMEAKLKQTEERNHKLQQQLEDELKKPVPEPVVHVVKTIETPPEITKRLNEQEKELEKAHKEKILIQNKLATVEKDSKAYQKLKSQMEALTLQKDDIVRQIEDATSISGLVVEVKHLLDKIAPIKYSKAMGRLDSEVVIGNLSEIIEKVESWSKEMRSYLPLTNNYVEGEVIE